jgi:hypothetical protein
MSLSISKAIKAIQLGDNNLKNTVFMPLAVPQGTTGNYVIYTRQSVDPQHSKDGKLADLNIITFEIYSGQNYDDGVIIAENIRTAFDGLSNQTLAGILIKSSTMTGASEVFGDNNFIQTLNFRFITN